MKPFYAVDPGVKYFAWVYCGAKEIVDCGLYHGRGRDMFKGETYCGLVIEDQRVFTGAKLAYREDIIDLAQAAGDIAGQFDDVTWAPMLNFTKPKKGQPSIPEQRCRKYLTPTELEMFLAHSKKDLEHIWDAGYFALKYSGRIT